MEQNSRQFFASHSTKYFTLNKAIHIQQNAVNDPNQPQDRTMSCGRKRGRDEALLAAGQQKEKGPTNLTLETIGGHNPPRWNDRDHNSLRSEVSNKGDHSRGSQSLGMSRQGSQSLGVMGLGPRLMTSPRDHNSQGRTPGVTISWVQGSVSHNHSKSMGQKGDQQEHFIQPRV